MSAAQGASEPLSYLESLSNWGRWGPDDQVGTLNLITEEHRVAAAQLVTTGRSVSCARDLGTAFGAPDSTAQMYWVATGEACNPPEGVPASKLGFGRVLSAVEFFGLVFHGPNVTHLDTAAHLFWDGRLYNDRPAAMTGAEHGALWCSVATMKDGVVGRGVLLDVARHLDVDALEPGTSVTAAQLQAAADAQGVAVGPGDIVLLRCGRWHQSLQSGAARRESDDFTKWEPKSGWHPDCMPWLHERDVAMIGCDYPQDPIPPSSFDIPGTIHVLALVTMGMPLLDNCDLEALASTCAELGRWEFQFVMSPLRIVGGSGSPVNPIAVF